MGTSQFTLRFSEPEVHIGVSNRRFIEPNRRFEPEVQTGYRWIINLKQNVKQQAMIHFRGKRFKEVQRTANRLPSSSGSIQRTANRLEANRGSRTVKRTGSEVRLRTAQSPGEYNKHRNGHESSPRESCEFVTRCILHRILVQMFL